MNDNIAEDAFGSELVDVLNNAFANTLNEGFRLCESAIEKPRAEVLSWIEEHSIDQQASLRTLYACASRSAAHLLANSEDHIKAFTDLIVPCAPAHLYCYMSIARVASESACLFAELQDIMYSPEERIIRGTALLLKIYQEAGKMTADLDRHSNDSASARLKSDATTIVANIESDALRSGIEVVYGNRGAAVKLVRTHIECLVRVNASELHDRRLVHVPFAYRLSSSFVHGHHYLMESRLVDRELQFPYHTDMLVHAALICLDSLYAMVWACYDRGDEVAFAYLSEVQNWMEKIVKLRRAATS